MRTAKKPIVKAKNEATGLRRRRPKALPSGRTRPLKKTESAPPPTLEVKVIAIGNSRGVRLPRALLAKYAIGDAVLLVEREEGLLLRGTDDQRLSWEDTYADMARAREDWSDLEATIADGLDKEPW